ncbi:MAG: VWA domain-containing protein [Flavobacteriaceae bacterium]|nr:VWA domain-containing protein [Bacteroidia bacterium]NNK69733.1 VWA domain-containing protein [Flavobacteriaceae bacterium]
MKALLTVLLASTMILNLNFVNANNIVDHNDSTMKFTLDHPEKRFIKVALLLDTSNSMDGLIDQAKAQLWEIVNELSYAKCKGERPNLKIALYEYGNDNLHPDEGYIRQVIGFSEDLDEISKELFSLTTNGGSEYCGHVIQTSLDQLKWGSNPDDLKLVFIAGNEPFTQGRVNYKNAAVNAKEKDVTVNTIFCGDYNQGISTYWRDGAAITGGDYMAINHNQKTVHIASPFDETILQLNIKLNKTYVGYGSHGQKKYALQAEQDSKARGYSRENAVSRTVSKSSHLYKNSSWDLVDAVESEAVDIEDLDDDDLPSELKGKSEREIKKYIEQKQQQRKAIQLEIQELNERRRAYIENNRSNKSNALESAMLNAIKAQAKEKQYEW